MHHNFSSDDKSNIGNSNYSSNLILPYISRFKFDFGKMQKNVGGAYDMLTNSLDAISNKARSETISQIDEIASRRKDGSGLKSFAQKLSEDLKNYDPNNTNLDKIINSNYFSSYKGKKVLKNDTYKNTKKQLSITCSYDDLIFLDKENMNFLEILNNKEYSSKTKENLIKQKKEELQRTMDHEYGHSIQFDNLGAIGYLGKVAIPSVYNSVFRYNDSSNLPDLDYYNQPWEYSADKLGGVNDRIKRGKVIKYSPEPVGEDLNPYSIGATLGKLGREIDSWH